MKRLILLLGSLLLLAGCESIEPLPSLSERYSAVPPQTKVVESDYRTTYYAAQQAMKKIDFVITKSAQAQGIVNGRSGLHNEDAFNQVRQYSFEVRLRNVDEKHTEVALLLHEQVEGDLSAGATDQALRSHGLYDAYFAALDQVLREGVEIPDTAR